MTTTEITGAFGEGPDGWGYEQEDMSVGITGGLVHSQQLATDAWDDEWTTCEPVPEQIVSEVETIDAQGYAVLNELWHCPGCGADLWWHTTEYVGFDWERQER